MFPFMRNPKAAFCRRKAGEIGLRKRRVVTELSRSSNIMRANAGIQIV